MNLSAPLSACLACGSNRLQPYLDLGHQPLANSCHDGTKELPRFALGVNICRDCWHSQLPVAVKPDLLFKNYLYVSGTTRTLQEYFADFVRRVELDMGRAAPLRVLDIASNDGSLLAQFKLRGHVVQGVDPAENLRKISEGNGVPTVVDYWGEAVAARLGQPFDVIIAMNVLAHVPTPLQFLDLCRRMLRPEGRIYVQTSQAMMVKNGEFDTIYHEHHSFFSVSSFLALARRAGLRVAEISHAPVHGTSYVVQMVNAGAPAVQRCDQFEVGRQETEWGYYRVETYEGFGARAGAIRDRIRQLVSWHAGAGYRLVGYGVAAKGMTFVNYAELDFDYLVDDNPLKVGLLTPGRTNPIAGPERLFADDRPTLVVVLAWNFFEEVVARVKAKRDVSRDAFLTYFPNISLFGYT